MSVATVVYVVYGVEEIDLSWIPAGTPVVFVHNDTRLDRSRVSHSPVSHVGDGENIGFGVAVNQALAVIETPRTILCNPDTSLQRHHFRTLAYAASGEIVAVPLTDEGGTPNSVVNRYWNAVTFVVTAHRLGRFVPRGGQSRRILGRLLGAWGRAHNESIASEPGTWSLGERWASGAVISVPTAAMRAVGGFDDRYFLYYEDVDLQQRLSLHDPSLKLRLAAVAPGIHSVGATDDGSTCVNGADVARIRRESARRYAQRQSGPAWRLAEVLVGAHTERGRQ